MTQAKPRGPVRRVPRAVREQQMLDAAVTVFSRQGYHAATVDEIAELAGISKPMVYLYFGSKEDLFVACIRREGGQLVEAIAAVVDPALPPDEQLWRGLRAFFAFIGERRDGWGVLYRQARGREPFGGEVMALRARVVEVVAALLGRAVAAGSDGPEYQSEEITAMAYALVGAGESLADWMIDHAEEPPEVTAARLMNFAWMGFANLLRGEIWHRQRD